MVDLNTGFSVWETMASTTRLQKAHHSFALISVQVPRFTVKNLLWLEYVGRSIDLHLGQRSGIASGIAADDSSSVSSHEIGGVQGTEYERRTISSVPEWERCFLRMGSLEKKGVGDTFLRAAGGLKKAGNVIASSS